MDSTANTIQELLEQRILILDGAMGTEIQNYRLDEQDYRGERYREHAVELKGNNDLLNITRPDLIEAIHRSFLEVGADIIETNTFNSTSIAQADYRLSDLAYELNESGAKLARRAVDKHREQTGRLRDLGGERRHR